jgi:hypothetical protein
MRYLPKNEFFRTLERRHPREAAGYFYNGHCGRLPERKLSGRASMARLVAETERLIALARPVAVLAFNDRLAGWRGLPRRRRHDPLRLTADFDVGRFLQEHVFFRDPDRYADNYYFTDPGLEWFVVFCHEGDWHLFGRVGATGQETGRARQGQSLRDKRAKQRAGGIAR